jgi:hypothetical protein
VSQQLLTLAAACASDLPRRVNLCADVGHAQRPRFIQMLNDTIERILNHGDFWGTTRPVRLCLTNGCVTLPRQVAALNAVRSCESVPLHNDWYSFLPFMGGCWNGCPSLGFTFQGLVPTFREECHNGVIRTYLQNAGDAGKTILYQGTDAKGKWVRSQVSGVWIDGEQVVLADPYVDTLNTFNSITGVQKDLTIDRVLVYKVLTGGPVHIATYEYDEIAPSYQRFRIQGGGLVTRNGCCNNTITPCNRTVEALVKLAYFPVSQDTDFLVIGNRGALRLGMQALKAEQDSEWDVANILWFGDQRNNRIGCIPMLNQELRTMEGDRVEVRSTPQGSARLSRVMGGFV